MSAYISFRNIKKYFPVGGVFNKRFLHAVNDVSFDIKKGEILAVVGESGSGKTTLARMLTRLYEPTSGDILIDGKSICGKLSKKETMHFRSKTQMIFQDPFGSLNPAHKNGFIVGRAVEMYNKGLTKSQVKEKVIELFNTVGLTPAEDFMGKHPNQLSGGQRQRIVIARALAVNPEIIVADEPTSMLDVSIGIDIMNLLLDLKRDKKLTYMYITHNLASARYMADDIIIMYAGNDVEQGSIEEVINKPLHPYTILLLSSTPEPFRDERFTIDAKEDLPDLASEKPCCMFCERCPVATDRCRNKKPPNYKIEDRTVRCFLYENSTKCEPLVDVSIYTANKQPLTV